MVSKIILIFIAKILWTVAWDMSDVDDIDDIDIYEINTGNYVLFISPKTWINFAFVLNGLFYWSQFEKLTSYNNILRAQIRNLNQNCGWVDLFFQSTLLTVSYWNSLSPLMLWVYKRRRHLPSGYPSSTFRLFPKKN